MARVHPEAATVEEPAPSEGALARTLGGLRAVGEHRDLRLIFALIAAQTFMRGAVTVFTVVVALELVGMGEAGVGALSAYLGAGALAASFGGILPGGNPRGWGGGSALVPPCGAHPWSFIGRCRHPPWPQSCSPRSAPGTR